jgi:hypothetical protein
MSLIRKITSGKPESVLNPIEPRTILLEGLPSISDLEILQGLEYALLDLMENFSPEKISLVTGQGIAYIRVRICNVAVYWNIFMTLGVVTFS